MSATPLPWLGGLLVLYLVVPIAAFAVHLVGAHDRGFNNPGLFGALYVSVVTATISTAIVALFGIPLAYALARSRGRLSTVVGVLVLLPLAMPPLMSGILLVELVGPYTALGEAFGRHLTDSMAGVVLAQTFVASPFLVVSARSAFAGADPTILEHAATLGHRELSRFWRVSLPMAAPGIRAGLVLSWLRAFGEYGATVILSYHPSALPVFTYVQFSSTGIPLTVAPTALGLGVAAVVSLFGRLPLRRRRPIGKPPASKTPRPSVSTPVGLDLDTRIGTFRLRVEHRSTSSNLAILGPSGSGKSATLRGIAGLLGSRAGVVHYGERRVDGVAVEDRRVGYVPQGYGLFPHLTLCQQVRFGRGADEGLGAYWLARLGLEGLEGRFPDELSDGQRQRVSLAQALARSPDLLLLDEPFSALDSPVRDELLGELRRLQRETAISTVIVTHDPVEAAYLADEVIVLHGGRVLQAGTKEWVFSRPSSPEVARLIGIGNLCQGRVRSSGVVEVAGTAVAMDSGDLLPGTEVLWCIRPEEVQLTEEGTHRALVVDRVELGATSELLLELSTGFELKVIVSGRPDLSRGASCGLALPLASIRLWPALPEASHHSLS
ncbi:MAG: ATP-binding cassette domain-containing protein [Acidimicrobiales bacterium]